MASPAPPAYALTDESKLEASLLIADEFIPPQKRRYSSRCRVLLAVFAVLFGSAFAFFLAAGSDLSWSLCQQCWDQIRSIPQTLHSHSKRQTSLWQPAVGTKWDYRIGTSSISNLPDRTTVLGVDLFDVKKSQIDTLHSNGVKVICYFSAGTAENWRSDYKGFSKTDLGKSLPDWNGEKYVNIRSSTVRSIMSKRIDMAASKGCDGVDPDNVDVYSNSNGISPKLTSSDGADYVNYLAGVAAAKGLSIGLKNAPEIISSVVSNMQWAITEECHSEGNCGKFQPFITAGKPVFNVEYPKGDNNSKARVAIAKVTKSCTDSSNISKSLSIILKNLDLDTWIQLCS